MPTLIPIDSLPDIGTPPGDAYVAVEYDGTTYKCAVSELLGGGGGETVLASGEVVTDQTQVELCAWDFSSVAVGTTYFVRAVIAFSQHPSSAGAGDYSGSIEIHGALWRGASDGVHQVEVSVSEDGGALHGATAVFAVNGTDLQLLVQGNGTQPGDIHFVGEIREVVVAEDEIS